MATTTASALRLGLAAAAGASATAAAVAAAVSGHDAAAEAAAGRVSEVDEARERVGGVDGAGPRASDFGLGTGNLGCAYISDRFGLRPESSGTRSETLEQHLLLTGQEAQLEPAEDVVHDALGVADVRIAAPAAGFEASVRELFAERLQRNAVLQSQRDSEREAVHQSGDRGSFLRHLHEEFAGFAVGIEADGDVSLMVPNFEFVRNRSALF